MQGNRFLTGFMRFVTGHATGMTGAEGVDVAVLMFFVLSELYKHAHDGQDKDDFYHKEECPEEESYDCSR